MGSIVGLTLARMGYNGCPAASYGAGIYSVPPVPEERLRRRYERKRQTPDAIRAEMRRMILANLRMIADPDNEWRRDDLERDLATRLTRYRLALGRMRHEPHPNLPCDRASSNFLMAAE